MSLELRRRVLITLGLVLAAEALRAVPIPGIDLGQLLDIRAGSRAGLPTWVGSRVTVGALGIWPYVAGSTLAALLFLARRGGARAGAGYPFEHHAILIALAVALLQGFAYGVIFEGFGTLAGSRFVPVPGPGFRIATMVTLAAGALLTAALARLVTLRGVGNGVCLFAAVELSHELVKTLTYAWGEGQPPLRDQAPVLGLVLVAFALLLTTWLVARWRAAGTEASDPIPSAEPLWLRVGIAGVAGVVLVSYLVSLPGVVAGILPAAPAWLRVFEPRGLSGGTILWWLLVVLATWLFTAWALDPARLVGAVGAGAPAGPAPLDERRFDRRALAAALPFVLLLPTAVALFGVVTRRLGAPALSAVGLAIIGAVALDTAAQFRARQRLARALDVPGGGEACGDCGCLLKGDEAFCPGCGAGLSGEATCAAHATQAAVARCVVCGRTLCADCARASDGRWTCEAHRAVGFVSGWATAATVETPVEAEGLRRRLAAGGIEASVLATTCGPLSASLGLYDLTPIVPLLPHAGCGAGEVRLLTRPGDWERAVALLAPPEAAPAVQATA